VSARNLDLSAARIACSWNVYEPTNSEPGNALEQPGDFSKRSKKSKALPVMVWIHGGGLTGGGGDL